MIIIVGLRPRPRRPHHGARFGGIEAPGFCFIQSGSSRIRFTCIYIYIYICIYTHIIIRIIYLVPRFYDVLLLRDNRKHQNSFD